MKGKRLGAGRQAEIFEWRVGQVLKLYHAGYAASAAQTEAELTRHAHAAGAPAPAVFETLTVEGRFGAVYERLSGPTMLSLLVTHLWRVKAFAQQMAAVHAQLHQCSGAGLPPQAARLRELGRWVETQALFAPALKIKLQQALTALPDGDRLCHGDFHPDNLLLTAAGPRVIDWTGAFSGHPLADVARTSIILKLGDPPPGFVQRSVITVFRALFQALYLHHYFRQSTAHRRAELRRWELPLAVARLTDGIVAERSALLKFITARAQEM
jgi:aminoglycoside phosphotransferase (APT) family kinase protein